MIKGGATGDKLGQSVKGAGDVNGDGISDVIIGAAYSNPNSRTQAGTCSAARQVKSRGRPHKHDTCPLLFLVSMDHE